MATRQPNVTGSASIGTKTTTRERLKKYASDKNMSVAELLDAIVDALDSGKPIQPDLVKSKPDPDMEFAQKVALNVVKFLGVTNLELPEEKPVIRRQSTLPLKEEYST